MDIHNNVPVPAGGAAGRPRTEYPFVELQVGQSFFVPLEGCTAATVANRMRIAAYRWRKASQLLNMKFRITSAPHPVTKAPCIGVWRIE